MTALRATRSGWGKSRSRDYYLEAGKEYIRRYGADELTVSAFAPAAAKRNGRPDLVERYYAGREDGSTWPSLNALKKNFKGSFNEYRRALGLEPNPVGGRSRRPPGTVQPILDVRERRVFTDDPTRRAWLERQLEKAERRADRLAEQLDTARAAADYRENPQIVELRKRLADEKHRRKEVQRELHNAVRREARARASSNRAGRRADSAALREVDRLTQKLVEVQDENRELRSTSSTVLKPKTKTVTRTVKVQDEKLVRDIARLQDRVSELRSALERSEAGRSEAVDRLANIRQEAVETAVRSERVRTAERRVVELEKQLAEQTNLLVGERRVLTEVEIAELRSAGPAGRVVLKRMIGRVARAEGREARRAALRDLAAAAINWSERL